jgi:RNA polymerase sigma-B factor
MRHSPQVERRASAGSPAALRVDRAGERTLFARYHRDGDLAARDEIVSRYLGLAHAVARRYSRSGARDDDLDQVASLGLVKAVDRFETERGTRFSTFAVPAIAGELKRHLREHGWGVHVPRAVQEEALAVARGLDALSAELGRTPTPRELAMRLELSVEEVLEGLEAASARQPDRLDAPVGGDQGETVAAGLGDVDERLSLAEARQDARRALSRLSEEERRLLCMRFFEELTQQEIAHRIGVSQMQVSRLLRAALDHANRAID